MEPVTPPVHSIAEKKEKFLLWVKKRKADEKHAAEEQAAGADRAYYWRAMMVWVDDGGRVS